MGVEVNYREDKKAWYVTINHLGDRGSASFGPDKVAANRFATEARLALKMGKFKMPALKARVPLKKYAEEVLALQGHRKNATMQSYRSTAENHIYPSALAKLPIGVITRDHIETFLNELPADATHGTKRLVLAVLCIIMGKAMTSEIIDTNPCVKQARAIPRSNTERLKEQARVKVLTPAQQDTVLERIFDKKGFKTWAFFFTLSRTGMRISEGSALMNDCLEFDQHRIRVCRNISDDELSTTKSGKVRYVPMTPQLEVVLRKMFDRAEGRLDAFTFPNQRGSFLRYNVLMKQTWDPIEADLDLGLGRITPHILRHTFASILLAQRKSIKLVSELLGHHSVDFTWKKYAHLIPGDAQNSIDCLDGAPLALELVVNNPIPQPPRTLAAPAGGAGRENS